MNKKVLYAIALLLALGAPFYLYPVFLMKVLCFALFACAFNLLIGFTGLLLTDDIDMEALNGTVPERAERAIAAGCDVVLNCWAKMADMEGIAERLPPISLAAQERLAAALEATDRAPKTGDRAQLIAKRDSLLKLTASHA